MIHSVARTVVMGVTLMFTASVTLAEETFVFTAIPDEDETRLMERFQGVADYLSEELDVNVRYIPVKSYSAAVSAFRNNQVQLAWFGGLSGVQARMQVPGSQAIAQGAEDTSFEVYFIANTSTGIEESDTIPDAIKGKTFTFGSKGSTSGRLMPEFYIRDAFDDQSPDDLFSSVGYSGNHTRTLRLVESGSYEVGAINFKVWEKELENGNVDTDAVRVIWRSPTYQNYQWSIRGDVNERYGDGFMGRVQQALLDLDDPELLESFPRSRFIEADNEDYEPIRKVAEQLGIID